VLTVLGDALPDITKVGVVSLKEPQPTVVLRLRDDAPVCRHSPKCTAPYADMT
jgi:hypothetical protein